MAVSFLRDLGPCEVSWNGAVLGVTYGGIKVKIDDQVAEIKEDGTGVIAVDAVFTGRKVADIEVPLTRFTIDQLDAIFHGAAAVADVLTISNVVGESMYDSAQELLIKPLINDVASVDASEWIALFKTFPVAKIELSYDNANQRVAKFAFQVFPSQESGYKGELGTFGHA
ncbi:MAG: hypothetical protein WC455_27740 [Dehalococcoidia bacterium]|jgi:hypothetical protein